MDEVENHVCGGGYQILESLIESGKWADPEDPAVLLIGSSRHVLTKLWISQ
jgi:hypothetical protein